MTFVPGYSNGSAPYGTWTVKAAYAPAGWLSSQDPDDDIVVLEVASRTIDGVSRTLESVVGAEEIGTNASAGTTVTALGYVRGTSGSVTSCTTTVTSTTSSAASSGSVATIDCAGFAGGTSGGPWLQRTTTGWAIVGIVGGVNQGGCSADVSYSPPLGSTLEALVARAGTSGDTLPAPGSDGC